MTSKCGIRWFVSTLGTLLIASSISLPAAAQASDWTSYEDEREAVVITRDADGRPRETTIWFVFVDSVLFIRAVRVARWGRNLDREPVLTLRIADAEYAVRASRVREKPLMAAVRGFGAVFEELTAQVLQSQLFTFSQTLLIPF